MAGQHEWRMNVSNRSDPASSSTIVLHGLIGGLIAAVFFFVPLSTVLGGAIAGYLEGGSSADGAKVGAIAGLVANIPLMIVLVSTLVFMPATIGPGMQIPVAYWLVLFFGLGIGVVYGLGFCILGGVIGAYVQNQR